MEKDDETNWYTTEFRQFDPLICRWLSIDPKNYKYPEQSPYTAFNNNPTKFTDPYGDDPPEDSEKHKSANGGELYLPKGTETTTFKGNETVASTKVKAEATEGGVNSFTINDTRYVASFNTKTGAFAGYRDAAGKMYQVTSEVPGTAGGDTDNWFTNVGWAADITVSYFIGAAGETRAFSNDEVARALANSSGVNKARNFFYDQANTGRDLVNDPITGVAAGFGFMGALKAGIDPIEQMVGTFRVQSIYVIDANTISYTMTNRTSTNSLLYDIGPSWDRSTFPIMGNVYQYYTFTEKIDFSRIYNKKF